MAIIETTTQINAPLERVFDLARSIDLHVETQSHHQESAIGGRTSGLMGCGERVTWRARHFGVSLTLTVQITQYDRPHHFRDSMIRGPFKRLDHDHLFEYQNDRVVMRDVFDFASPFAILGRLADKMFVHAHMTRLLVERNRVIKRIAESDRWREFLPKD